MRDPRRCASFPPSPFYTIVLIKPSPLLSFEQLGETFLGEFLSKPGEVNPSVTFSFATDDS